MSTDLEEMDPMEAMSLYYEEQAVSIRVVDDATFELVAQMRREARDEIKSVEAWAKPIKQAQDAAKKVTLEQERIRLAGPKKFVEMANAALTTYEREKAREKLISEARAAEEAKVLEAARPAPAPGAPALPPIVVPAVPVSMPKVEGLGFSTHYKAGVRDLRALATAVGEGKVPDFAISAEMPMLNDMARQFGPSTTAAVDWKEHPMPGVPGVVIVAERRARG